MKCRSPTWSDDSGKHSAPSVLSEPTTTRPVFINTVEIRKKRGETLGIVFAHGPSDVGCPAIASFRPGSTAGRSDQLSPGDRVRSVNGISTQRMHPDELASLLDNVIGDTATLELEYCLPDYSSQGSLCVQTKITTVTIERMDGSLGITLRGGIPVAGESQTPSPIAGTTSTPKPLIVTHVRPGGPAHRSGRIKIGDRILKVDHHSLTNKTLLDAQQLLKQTSSNDPTGLSVTSLTVEYDVSVLDSVRWAAGPLLVEVARRPHESLGLSLGPCGPNTVMEEIQPAGVFIESIAAASIADRCGALHVGDQIIAVDDTYIEGSTATSEEVTWLLENYDTNQGCTRLQIVPYHVIVNGHNQSNEWLHRGLGHSPSCTTISSLSTISRRRPRHFRSSKLSEVESPGLSYQASTLVPLGRGLCHVETLTVALTAEDGVGFGFEVGTDSEREANVVVTRIEGNSPAYRCGCLQTGDKLVSLNGQCSMSLQEVRSLLDIGCSSPGSRLLLQTEFDVADTVVPASGVFTVKIAKNGPDLGITITSSKTIPDDPFIISDIRRGSAAHRTGTLHVGDHVLAIDNQSLDHPSLDEAFDGVQNSQSDIVTLRIQKIDETDRETLIVEPPEEIVYTVELNRRGGPLGITVSGSENRSEPIVLNALTQGGLAEKTGALHVGDRILAINGENLERRPLSDAIRLLQTSGDKVQIKIARQIKNNTEDQQYQDPRVTYSSPGLTSIDSAVESWDSGVPEQPSMDTPCTVSHPQESLKSSDTSTFITYQAVDQNLHHGVYQPQLEMTTFRNNNNNKKHHESQLLFYSDVEDSLCPSPLPLPNFSFTNTLPKYDSTYFFCSKPNMHSRNEGYKYSRQDVDTYSSASTIPDVEIHYVTLHKDSVYDDYGFSVSDGLYEKGVYINRIRRGGPAHLAGVLRPYDRILQVNDTKTKDFDCCLTVPLIASAGDKIELVVARNPYIGCPDQKDMHILSWTPDEQESLPRLSTKSFSTSNQNTITKTL